MLFEIHYKDISGWKYKYVKLTAVQAADIAMKLQKDDRCLNVYVEMEEYV